MKTILKICFVFAMICQSAKATINIDQFCTNNLLGPVASISCSLVNVEPDRSFWLTLHYEGAATVTFTYPGCLTPLLGPQSLMTVSGQSWFYHMEHTSGSGCCTGSEPFSANFSGSVSNVQIFVAQIQGLDPASPGSFNSTNDIVGAPFVPTVVNTTSNASDFIGGWLWTSLGEAAGITAGGSYTFLGHDVFSDWEWKIAGAAGPYTVDWTGTPAGTWALMSGSFSQGSNRPSFCTVNPVIHRRQVF